MVDQETVEEHGVPLLQEPQEDVPPEVGRLGAILELDPLQLRLQGLDRRGQETDQTQPHALVRAERGALVLVAVGEQVTPVQLHERHATADPVNQAQCRRADGGVGVQHSRS